MGDVVHTLPVAVALKRSDPQGEIVWMVDAPFREIVDRCPAVDVVVVRDKAPRSALRQARGLGPFDLALDMQGLLKSALVVASARARRRLGYHWQREGSRLASSPVLPDPGSVHVVDQYVDVARAAGAEADRAEWGLAPTDEDLAQAKLALKEAGWAGEPIVAMNAGAGWATKRWHPREFAGLARHLAKNGLATAFLGAPGERGVWDSVAAHDPGPALDLIGRTSVGALVGLVSMAEAHVGGDTGSSHIAAALGKPAFSVFTLTRPERSCPYGQLSRCFDAREAPVEWPRVAESVLRELRP
jgi:ADP-heptose:LPS heptosyltransferase